VDNAHRIANQIVHRINEGMIDSGCDLEEIANAFHISSRQLRRIVQKELGVSPIELMQTRRLLLAKQLLSETKLPAGQIAYASGFSSLRRFNDAFVSHYRMPPTRLRKDAAEHELEINANDTSVLRMSYRPPYAWAEILDFLAARSIKGVEVVTSDSYARTVRLGNTTGWIRVSHAPAKCALLVEFNHSLAPVLPALLGRLRNLFDLDARPDIIAEHLMRDSRLRRSVAKHPGLRVPGTFDGFEMAIRAILGQQITVKAATTIAGRLAETFGQQLQTPIPGLNRLSPSADEIARASVDDIASLGIVSARAKSIIALAQAYSSGSLQLHPGTHPEAIIPQLTSLPGIGEWTAQYIAMRALHWPDAFPKEDIAVRKNLGGVSARQAEEISQPWRPWRSYAVVHIWKSLTPV
jgi:AraC family transcriptional regulator of adaptative response / DNA-3-methyladenine glycosylase II